MAYSYLDKVNIPADFKNFSIDELELLSNDCRQFLIDTMSKTSGHFASSLGVVELSVALHFVFDTPDDKIVWDVGHQAYIHKILTGRKELFTTLRKYKGLSGFPKRSESEYDTFGVGHASTSISAAYGMRCGLEKKDKKNHVIAIIGDGSLTGGLAFEGMNNAGAGRRNLIVILNDNDMSIDSNVGAFNEKVSKAITKFVTSKFYNDIKSGIWDWAEKQKRIGKLVQKIGHKIEEGMITTITPGAIFEQLGFDYVGPIDGHDLPFLIETLQNVKQMHGPILIHLITKKGKGYSFAEMDALKYHAVSTPFDPDLGMEKKSDSDKIQFMNIFGDAICELAEKDKQLVVITPAMISGSGLKKFEEKFPEQLYDVGIAEGHAVTFSAGMATQNIPVICSIYSTFIQRAYDNLIHDVAIQNLHVVFVIDRAGVVGPDGATHHGCFDISFLRCIPQLKIMAPSNADDLRNMLYTALYHESGPIAIRYPRDGVKVENPYNDFEKIEFGKAKLLKSGKKVAVLILGPIANNYLILSSFLEKNNIHASFYDMRYVKPIDEKTLLEVAQNNDFLITVEEGSIQGGFGSAVLEFLADSNLMKKIKLKRIGIPDRFIDHGSRDDLFKDMELDSESIAEAIVSFISNS
jgi:1-deoxy-D-xylulose-5-phosphate synthase